MSRNKVINGGVNVILYCRVSSEEQAEGSSLDYQEMALKAYCANHNYNILMTKREDHSAKSYTLDRPELKSIYDYCKKNKGEVNKVLFLRWDRFTRSLEFATVYKRKFMDELGVEINAVENPIDFNGTEWSTMLGIYCGVAHTEDEKISKRTKDGIHGTLLKGKCSNKAPRGYKNVRHGKHDTEVIIDTIVAPKVKEAFAAVASGSECPNRVRQRLFPKVGKSSFSEMLRNVFYIGKIRVPAYKDDPEQIVDGVHEALIDEETFYKVQEILDGRKKNTPKMRVKLPHPDFFMRTYLVCPICGHAITASHSRSRNGNKYGYYHCSHDQKHLRVRAEQANESFARYIGALKPNRTVLNLYETVLEELRTEGQKSVRETIRNIEDEIVKLQSRIEKAMDAYLDNEITKEEKQEMVNRYKRDIVQKEQRIAVLKTVNRTNIEPKLGYAISLIDNMEEVITDAPTETKMLLLGSMFPDKIEFDGENYRTASYNKVLDLIYQQTNELREPMTKKKNSSLDKFSLVPGTGLEPALLSEHAPETCASTNSATRAGSIPTHGMNLSNLCPGQDLNLHRLWRLPPQSSVSTNSTTWAAFCSIFLSKAGAKV